MAASLNKTDSEKEKMRQALLLYQCLREILTEDTLTLEIITSQGPQKLKLFVPPDLRILMKQYLKPAVDHIVDNVLCQGRWGAQKKHPGRHIFWVLTREDPEKNYEIQKSFLNEPQSSNLLNRKTIRLFSRLALVQKINALCGSDLPYLKYNYISNCFESAD